MMNLAICSLASGSSGNCYVVRTENTALLVDAGISARRIQNGLAGLGLRTSDLAAVLVTHEHDDHVKGLKVLSGQLSCIFANEATFAGLPSQIPAASRRTFVTGGSFSVGDILVESFSVSHDAADPVGFAFSAGGRRLAIVTDTGTVTEEIVRQIRLADILVLESNHDENVLRAGPYPWFLKRRILSERGHLSNEAAAEALAIVMQEEQQRGAQKLRTVLLAHLSRENNFPELALATMENVLQEHGCSPRMVRVEALSRSEASPVYAISGSGA